MLGVLNARRNSPDVLQRDLKAPLVAFFCEVARNALPSDMAIQLLLLVGRAKEAHNFSEFRETPDWLAHR
jgi:hypothetical protein